MQVLVGGMILGAGIAGIVGMLLFTTRGVALSTLGGADTTHIGVGEAITGTRTVGILIGAEIFTNRTSIMGMVGTAIQAEPFTAQRTMALQVTLEHSMCLEVARMIMRHDKVERFARAIIVRDRAW
jgi:hypothetical protein